MIPLATLIKTSITSSVLVTLTILSIFNNFSLTSAVLVISVSVILYDVLNILTLYPSNKSALSLKTLSLTDCKACSWDTNSIVLISSISLISFLTCSISSSVASFFINAWIPCWDSTCFIKLLKLPTIIFSLFSSKINLEHY